MANAEILAPAGSPDAFIAAVEHGADAVYCGLQQFNARGNAINFTAEALAKYVPFAHQHGTRVYLTLNTIVKMEERAPLLRALDEAAAAGIDGVILQDLGLARVMAKYFPTLRRHASTQMAIHNLEGVRFCVDEGMDRVVLARELTFDEIREIRNAFPADVIELEVFCHGAMCYTYSGMCFFSGSVGGRSGNRGECAYTCRKGYKIHNETSFPMAAPKDSFNNYLFSMKDMNTLDVLPQLLETGIDSLKIEGRRKGPAYVGASVRAYRERMDGSQTEQREGDMKLAFARSYTGAFYKRGQFGDHPIDVTATGTQGVEIGKIDANNRFVLKQAGIQRYDGIRLVMPDRSETNLAFKQYEVNNGDRMKPELGTVIRLLTEAPLPQGTRVFWVRSQAVEQRYKPGKLRNAQGDEKPGGVVDCHVTAGEGFVVIRYVAAHGEARNTLLVQPSDSDKQVPLKDTLFRFGDTPFTPGRFVGPECLSGFIPMSQLKKLRRRLLDSLKETAQTGRTEHIDQVIREANQPLATPGEVAADENAYIVRLDQLENLRETADFLVEQGAHLDFVMRPTISTPDWRMILDLLRAYPHPVRLVLPMVLRKWDLRLIRRRMQDLVDDDFTYVIANPGHFYLLPEGAVRHADFSVYHINTWALKKLEEHGIDGRFSLSLEDDKPNMEALLAAADPSRFEAIAYTDTPLFVAEACSLAALYGGCPGAKTCKHETLHIENEHGDRFMVRHDRCRSTVIGNNALSWSGSLHLFVERGVRHFRIDFTTRPYSAEELSRIVKQVMRDQAMPQTHSENLERVLL
jgi:putative protease